MKLVIQVKTHRTATKRNASGSAGADSGSIGGGGSGQSSAPKKKQCTDDDYSFGKQCCQLNGSGPYFWSIQGAQCDVNSTAVKPYLCKQNNINPHFTALPKQIAPFNQIQDYNPCIKTDYTDKCVAWCNKRVDAESRLCSKLNCQQEQCNDNYGASYGYINKPDGNQNKSYSGRCAINCHANVINANCPTL